MSMVEPDPYESIDKFRTLLGRRVCADNHEPHHFRSVVINECDRSCQCFQQKSSSAKTHAVVAIQRSLMHNTTRRHAKRKAAAPCARVFICVSADGRSCVMRASTFDAPPPCLLR